MIILIHSVEVITVCLVMLLAYRVNKSYQAYLADVAPARTLTVRVSVNSLRTAESHKMSNVLEDTPAVIADEASAPGKFSGKVVKPVIEYDRLNQNVANEEPSAIREPSAVKEPSALSEPSAQKETVTNTESEAQVEMSHTADILNDYIGEFFTQDTAPSLDAYRVVPVEEKESVEANTVEAKVEDELPIITEKTDIPVAAKSVVEKNRDDQRMSNKVLNAMLDEAELVCAS